MASNVVPYTPVPSAAPNAAPASPYLRVPSGTQEAAGVGVASAVQGFGHQVEQASDKVSQQVLALQGLQNETLAKDGDVDVMVKIGQAQSEYDQLEGQNAADALPAHIEKIKKIRQEALDGMPNPMARRMLDQSISRRVGFAIVDSGHKAGTQMRVATKQASGARVEAAVATADPTSPNSLTLAEQTITSEIEAQGRDRGELPETVDENKRKALSKLWLTSINKAGPNNPEMAKSIFEIRKDQMDPNTREAALGTVNRYMASKQTRTDAQSILDKIGFDPTKGPGQLTAALEEAKKWTEKKGKDNPDYGFYLEERVKALVNTGMSGHRDQQTGYEYDIGKFILGQNDANKVVSIDGLIGPNAPKEIRDAYTSLDLPAQKRVLNWVAKMAKGEGNQWTPDKLRKWNQLKGMASDPESTEDFYNMGPEGILKENLPLSATRELMNLQRTVKTRAENIQLNQAMTVVDSQLTAAGISRKQDPEAYLQFRGALEDQLRDAQGETKAKVPPEQVRVMASRLLQDTAKHWWSSKDPVYASSNIPEEDKTEITKALQDKGFINPTDQDIQRAYSYILYKRLYNKKNSAASKADKSNLEGLGQ